MASSAGNGNSNGWGGRRDNQTGRPPGSPNVKHAKQAVALAFDGGLSPFAIMLKTARGLWMKAAPDGETIEDYELAKDAAEVAAKAAPYVHPKLSAIQIESANDEPFVIRFDREDRDA